jgi:outer membrane protein OmpU
MKKVLYGTTSLVAAGMVAGAGSAFAAAQPLSLSLSGYYQFYGIIADEDQEGAVATNDNGSITSIQEAEINFNMRGELDNGLKIGGRIELEGDNNGDQIDQHWLTLEGGWGRVDLGAANSGRYNMAWATNAPNVGLGITSGYQSHWMTFNSGLGGEFRRPFRSANVDAANDDQGITYWTPTFSGFRLAVTYRPQVSTTTTGGNGGSNRGALPNEHTAYNDAFDIGVSYSGSFSDVSITSTLGYATASAPRVAKQAVQVGVGDNTDFDDYESINAGLVFGFQGFQVGGMLANVGDGFCQDANGDADCSDAADRSTEGDSYVIGASYGQGPWAVSATYHNGEEKDSIGTAGDSEFTAWTIAGRYTLGPGVSLTASYQEAEEDNEDNIAANGNKSDAFILGVVLGF